MTSDDLMLIAGEHAADRLMRSQKIQPGSVYLHGEDPPTPTQVSAVLHALADHTLIAHMHSEEVLTLGDHRAHLGGTWRQDSATGRFFQRMGDRLDWEGAQR